MTRQDNKRYEAVTENDIEVSEKLEVDTTDLINNTKDNQLDNAEDNKLDNTEEEEEEEAFQKEAKVSIFQRLKGFLLVAVSGVIVSVVGAVAKHLKHIPIAQYLFLKFSMTLLIISPLFCFLQPRIDCCGKLHWIAIRCILGGIAGIIRFWSFVEMDLGDAMALFATTPIFAGIFARIMLKEKINIFIFISAALGISGIILIAKPNFIFGDGAKSYSWFALLPLFGAVCLGFAYTSLRKIGTDIHYLLIPFVQMNTMIVLVALFYCAMGEELVAPGCFGDRLIIFLTSFAVVVVVICLNRGLAIERTGPVTLVRNLDTVYAYVIQIVFFKKSPELLSYVGAGLILIGTIVISLNKLLFKRYKFCEI